MHIEILGAESLGVRGLSCVVEVKGRKIVIDPDWRWATNAMGCSPIRPR